MIPAGVIGAEQKLAAVGPRPTLGGKVSRRGREERSCLNGSFLSPFSHPGELAWLFMSVRGCSGTPAAPLCVEGWLGLSCLSLVRFCHVYVHARTIGKPSQRCGDGGEKTLLRGRFGKKERKEEREGGVLHTIAARSLTDASQAPGNVQKRFTCTTKANVGFVPALSSQNTTSPFRFKSTASVGKVGIFRSPARTHPGRHVSYTAHVR